MNITMPRGDIRPVSFTVTQANGTDAGLEFDEIYFTVKSTFQDKSFLFQKRLGNGTITREPDGSYAFVIRPEDTDGLRVAKYVFDIELVLGSEIKQTTVGELILTNEVTFAGNEG
ncbi:MAG: hypothetical protein IJ214_12415 [Clostridia bacterium]|nr:hypothetical protein [Clostridia bacterium]